jgi:hypothetical protein
LAVRPPSSGAWFGAYVHAPRDRRASVTDFERLIGRKLDIDHVYYQWDARFPTADDRWDIDRHRLLFISWQTQTMARRQIPWADVAAGQQDSIIDARARAIRALGVPVLISFEHEPGALVGKVGSAADYVAAWRHVVGRFVRDGVKNVSWVWTVTSWSFRRAARTSQAADARAAATYPGDDVIDWIAVDGYNFAGCRGMNAPWLSFAQIFSPWYDWAARRGKPLMVAEFGLSEDPLQPGRKGAWFGQMAQQVLNFPAIKAYVYFESAPRCDNYVTSSRTSLAGFRSFVRAPHLNAPLPAGQ